MKMKDYIEMMEEQQPGEWRANPFLDPQVRKKIQELKDDLTEAESIVRELQSYTDWVNEMHPELAGQYKALKDIRQAGRDAEGHARHKFFGEIK